MTMEMSRISWRKLETEKGFDAEEEKDKSRERMEMLIDLGMIWKIRLP